MSEELKLKPCPKCGPNGAPLRRIGETGEYRVECVECYTVRTPWFKTLGDAEAYWNAFAEGMKQQGTRIAELEAERDHFREVAEKLVWLYSDEHQGRLDNGLRIDGFYSHEWLGMILDMAREAMKGAEK